MSPGFCREETTPFTISAALKLATAQQLFEKIELQ